MSLYARIEKDYLTAFKAKKTDEVAVLRMLKAAVKNKQVDLRRELTDSEILDVVAKQVKQRQESIDQFRAAGRIDLAEIEEREHLILRAYLPTALSPHELEEAVVATIQTLAASGMKDMGKVMNAILGEHAGRVDGKELSALVRAKLSS
ncbi:GatB/YqeY domain-containing protein [Desulfomicrobium baculatum]|uniref:GatB/YqeY domain-containing protein n=1 Tax=Desulfomicrobium baculatum (strain DSM 4028 / VKM B-1378 / X) TaxID=525897 RepID=C7LRN1_DESBD|nr:GatB/YqeY domain-containing protein [Desulfomicrobium baculatum]ACU90539.1 GatB/YqeY domain-containing protein [Desulfomicrobium baculatum DSM 4028]